MVKKSPREHLGTRAVSFDMKGFPQVILVANRLRTAVLTLFIVLVGISPLLAQTPEEEGWKLVQTENELKVYTRTSEGSNLKEIRVTLTMESTIAKIADFLGDVPGYTSWVYKCIYAEEVQRQSANALHYYVILDFPFPLQHRDMMVSTNQWIDEKTGVYYSESKASGLAHESQEGFVRINTFNSRWAVRQLDEKTVHIDYQSKSDPGGFIPVWIVNLVITTGPVNTMRKFIELVNQQAE